MEDDGRREQVLGAALLTFARYGYKKTSMEDVARAADISRPGLYFLFESKQKLFREAVTQALDADVEAARRSLTDPERPLPERLIEAFDRWTGRYLGPMAREVAVLRETHPELLGSVVVDYPRRFLEMVTAAVSADLPARSAVTAADVARTLVSTARGIKEEVTNRDDFVARMTVAVTLVLAGATTRTGRPA